MVELLYRDELAFDDIGNCCREIYALVWSHIIKYYCRERDGKGGFEQHPLYSVTHARHQTLSLSLHLSCVCVRLHFSPTSGHAENINI